MNTFKKFVLIVALIAIAFSTVACNSATDNATGTKASCWKVFIGGYGDAGGWLMCELGVSSTNGTVVTEEIPAE